MQICSADDDIMSFVKNISRPHFAITPVRKLHNNKVHTDIYIPSGPPEDLVVGCSILYHQKGTKAIASTVDKEDHGLCKSVHQR